MITKRFIIFFLLIAFFFAPSHSRAEEPQPVTIGLIFPLSGPMSAFGQDMAQARPLIEERFNTSQSRYRFSLIIEDGKFGQSNAAITAAKKLVEANGAKFLVTGSSGETLQVAPYAESAGILTVAGFSVHPGIKAAGDFIFRTYVDAGRGIDAVAADIEKHNFSRLAVISEETSFTTAVKDSLYARLGPKIIFSELNPLGDADFKTLVVKARSAKPEAFYLNVATPANFIALHKQLRDNGIKAPFYTYYVPSLKEVQYSLGPTLLGTTYLDFPDSSESSEDFNSFLRDYQGRYGKVAISPFNFRTNYDAVKVIFDGIVAVGPDPAKVRDYLYSYDQPGATGRLQFDGNGDVKNLNLILKPYTAEAGSQK